MKFMEVFQNIPKIKSWFSDLFQHKKQIKALENYDFVKQMKSLDHYILSTIKFSMKGSFLEEEDSVWLSKKLERLEINYLDWCYKTKWVKSQFEKRPVFKNPEIIQTTFDFFGEKRSPVHVPIEILARQQAAKIQRVVR